MQRVFKDSTQEKFFFSDDEFGVQYWRSTYEATLAGYMPDR